MIIYYFIKRKINYNLIIFQKYMFINYILNIFVKLFILSSPN